jgi:hypothetical protein
MQTELNRLKNSGLLYSSEVFSLANRIKQAMISDASFASLKSQLPQSVQILMWSAYATMENEAYPGQFFYASLVVRNANTRFVFLWLPGGNQREDPTSYVKFSTENAGQSFSIKNVHFNEYFYPEQQSPSRVMSLWRPQTLESTFYWNVELLGDAKIRIKSSTYGEYVY